MRTRLYRIIQILFLCALIFGGIYAWRWLTDPAEFPVKSVKIHASYEHLNQQALQEIVVPYLSESFIKLDTHAIQEDLLKFPWVAKVEVERIWPSTLLIKITEHQAIASLGERGLLDSKGQVFTPPADTLPTNLPILEGPADQTTAMWKNYQAISDTLIPLGWHIQKLTTDPRLSLQVDIVDDKGRHLRLLLGKTDPLPRLQRFVKVHPKVFTADAQAEYVDLRYDNGVAVKWLNSPPPE